MQPFSMMAQQESDKGQREGQQGKFKRKEKGEYVWKCGNGMM